MQQRRNIQLFILFSILFIFTLFSASPFVQAKQSEDYAQKKQILKILQHYVTVKIPKSYDTEPFEWDDGSGVGINLQRKGSKSSQTITLSVIRQDETVTSPAQIVSDHVADGGRDFGSIRINGFTWVQYSTGYEKGGSAGEHRCAATLRQDFLIWACLSPKDIDYPIGITLHAFKKFVKSIKIKRNATFIPSDKFLEWIAFDLVYKQLHRCSAITNEERQNACIQKVAEKALVSCQKFKRDCDYLFEQVGYSKTIGTDEEVIPKNEVFDNISTSLDNLRSGGASLLLEPE